MDTEERRYVRDLALAMEATYEGNQDGLRKAQEAARGVVGALRASFPNADDETRAYAARAVARVVAYLAQLPTMVVGTRMESIAEAYPMASAALLGVYVLPDLPESGANAMDDSGDSPPAKPVQSDQIGMFL